MKITKAKLKQIIKEELEGAEEPVEKQVDLETLVNLVVDERLVDIIKKHTDIEVADADIANALAAVVGWRSPHDGSGFKIVTKREWEF